MSKHLHIPNGNTNSFCSEEKANGVNAVLAEVRAIGEKLKIIKNPEIQLSDYGKNKMSYEDWYNKAIDDLCQKVSEHFG